MEKINEHPILEFPSDIIDIIRKQYNLDKPGQMDAAIDLLDQWIRKQAHFTKTDFSREYLERAIIIVKGSVERAKNQTDKLFSMKTSVPHFFVKINAKTEFENLREFYVDAMLPKMTEDHYRIYAGNVLRNGVTTKHFTLCYQFGTLLFEHIKAHDYCSGFIGLLDYRDVNILDIVGQVNIMEMAQYLSFITEGYQARVKAIHLLTPSKAVELIIRLFRQMLPKKIGDRIQVHATLESLHKYLPKEVLPSDLGGDLNKTLAEYNQAWVDVLSTEENMKQLREMHKAKVNEKLRDGAVRSKDDLLGMPGSFRTLVVD